VPTEGESKRHAKDVYPDFAALAASEREGKDFRVSVRPQRGARIAVVAPHGGGIEPGTSEVAAAIAGKEYWLYSFEGLKRAGNGILHVTSTRFDEPRLLNVLSEVDLVLTVHGEGSEGEAAFIGGEHRELLERIIAALKDAGVAAKRHEDAALSGTDSRNICNRGRSGKGVQIELSEGLRRTFFSSLSARGRGRTTSAFEHFVRIVRETLSAAAGSSPHP
jgi:phage replication-related protein YjqB (UPF0714/DUF867 family)